ncbi:MAG: hydrogenase iron-sulfur subunit, partial [Anaerolineae bacterium]|nr:hydrogenase iron-sulfur subunit [Anaerolineae bacterium]
LLGLFIVHILRLMRARIWSPRWVVILSTLALVLLSLLKPVSSAQPANLNRFIESVTLDAWYLGFLPLIDTYGSLPFWGFTVALFAVATLLPWLAKGKHDGPAVVENSECTGCALCATECPYRAIEMDYRHDDTSRFKSLAFVNPNMCTGCGLCVGTCAMLGIELQGVPTLPLYDHGLLSALKQSVAAGAAPTVIFTCQRHAALGSLPSSAGLNQWQPAEHPGVQPPVYLGASTTQSGSAITCVLPCIGMVDVDWVKELFAYGAADIALLGCPLDDCNYREGPLWLSRRLSRRKAILKPNLHWLSAAPGDKKALAQFLKRSPDQPKSAKPVLPYFKLRQLAFPKFPSAAMALLVLSLLFASALPLDMTSRSPFAHQSQLRFGIEHQGVVTLGESLQDFELPEGVVVNPGQLSTGKHHPVQLRVEVDGQTALQQTFQPRGLHNDGEIDGVETITLAPGVYSVQIFMNDDSEDWRLIYSGELELGTAQIVTFMYAQDTDSFILH